MATKKRSAEAKQGSKTDALSIRIDPRLRYGLELLARQQRRSVTGVVEWAIERALRDESITDQGGTFAEALRDLWSPNEFERLVYLATKYPDLMTYEESRMWRVILDTEDFWLDRKRYIFNDDVVELWDRLKPLLISASEKSVVIGLTREQLRRIDVDLSIPF